MVQPDLFIVCDKSKLDGQNCNGAPDLVLEILSPSSEKHDLFRKFNLYRLAGVKEYWILDPETQGLLVHLLKEGEYITRAYGISEEDGGPMTVKVGILEDLRAE